MNYSTKALICICLAIMILAGCSSNQKSPVTAPVSNMGLELVLPCTDIADSNRSLLGIWSLEVSPSSQKVNIIPCRDAEFHINVAPYIPFPEIHINSYDPLTDIMDLDITINNSTPIDVYDVRLIIFTGNAGNYLVNADDWTGLYDIPGGLPINPFAAFGKRNPNRIFNGMSEESVNILLTNIRFAGSIKIAIDASVSSNCNEPYQISNFNHTGLCETGGSTSEAYVTVRDWQDNTSAVRLYCPEILGASLGEFTRETGDIWALTLENTAGASAGNYTGYVVAFSADSGSVPLYDQVKIKVCPSGIPSNPVITGDTSTVIKPYDIASKDNYIFVTDRNNRFSVTVFDVSNPIAPEKEKRIFTDYISRVEIFGNYAYVSMDGVGMEILDVSNPEETYSVYHTNLYTAFDIDVENNSACLISDWFRVMDVSDPSNPVYLGGFQTDGLQSVEIFGDYAYYGNKSGGFSIVDINDRENPVQIGSITTGNSVLDMAIYGHYLYLCNSDHGFVVYDLTDPVSPVHVTTINFNVSVDWITIHDHYAFITISNYSVNTSIVIFDLNDPAAPIRTGSTQSVYMGHGSSIVDDYLYFATDYGIVILNVLDKENPFIDTFFRPVTQTFGIKFENSHVYASAGRFSGTAGSFDIYDASNANEPSKIGSLPMGGCFSGGTGVDVSGSYAYLADGIEGFKIVNVADPANPAIIGQHDTESYAYDLAFESMAAFVANSSFETSGGSLEIFKVSNPSNPVVLSSINTISASYDVEIQGDYAYIAATNQGLIIADISDMENPQIIESTNPGDAVIGLDVEGKYAYLAVPYDGLYIYDVHDVSAPTPVGYVGTVPILYDAKVQCGYAYCAAGAGGLVVIDVHDPANPSILTQVFLDDQSKDIDVCGNFAYLPDEEGGIKIVQLW
jgi:hypothetical protein